MFRYLQKKIGLIFWSAYKEYMRLNPNLTYLFWESTLNCNFFCKHCGSSAGKRKYKDELSNVEIKKTFKEIANDFDISKITLAVTGGEPLLRSDLFDVMDYAKQLGFRWGMVTNGFLVTEKVVKKMKQTGMKTVVVSIDGLGLSHDHFRGTKNAYEHAVRAIKLMVKENFLSDIQITTSLHKGNIDQLEAMYQQFIPLGITSWRIINVDPIGRAEKNHSILLNGEDLKYLLNFIKEKRNSCKTVITYGCSGFLGLEYEKEVRNNYFCCNTGISAASILHNGDIFVCPNVPRRKEFIQGNVRKDRFSTIWKEKFKIFRSKTRTSNKECLSCKHWDKCLGNSFHLWDFNKNKTKFCHIKALT